MEGKIYYQFFKKDLEPLVKKLAAHYQVWLPVEKNNRIDFQLQPNITDIRLEYQQGYLGLKKIFFPPSETLFEADKNQVKVPPLKKPIAVIGAHPVDLIGLQRLDESFAQAPADFYWQRRRKNSFIIGISPKLPNKYFTDTLGKFPLIFDLFFHRVARQDYFLVETGSKAGQNFIKNRSFFKPTRQRPPAKKPANRKSDFILSDPLIVSKIIEKSRQSKIWDQLEKICLNCGICTYVCPLCYCFSMNDESSIEKTACRRCRYWDACTLAKFSQISGGYNFRPHPKDRLYNWYYHKFVRAPKERGKIDCIGCHRCTEFCPAGIDFRKVIRALAKEQNIEIN